MVDPKDLAITKEMITWLKGQGWSQAEINKTPSCDLWPVLAPQYPQFAGYDCENLP